jgi:hypothetical protein
VALLVARGVSLGEVRDELVSRGKKEKAFNQPAEQAKA